MVTKDADATLGMVGVVVVFSFDDQEGHCWDFTGCIVFMSDATIICFVDNGVDIVIREALFLFLMAS